MLRPASWRRTLFVAVIASGAAVTPLAQGDRTIRINVTETAGIRRTEFPVRARVSLPREPGTDAARARLRLGDAAVLAQSTVVSRWPDNSPREMDVDFNASLAPSETRRYQLDFQATDAASGAPPRGLTVTEEGHVIHIGNMTFGRPGMPLMVSGFYARREFIGTFDGASNDFAIVDEAGVRHGFLSSPGVTVEIVKRGPLVAVLRYAGAIALGRGDSVSVTLMVEMPNSKSWVKVSASVSDPSRRVRELVLDTPLTMGAFPWTWDIGTGNGSYGAFRAATDVMTFRQVVDVQGRHAWRIDTGIAAEPRPYEISAEPSGEPGSLFGGWGHLVGESGAIAFGIDRVLERPGTYTAMLDARGQTSYRLAPASPATSHEFVVYQHFVSTPVAIGAATSPTSMLRPPVVTVEP